MYNVGIDWADKKHDITIVDHTGEVIVQNFTVKNNLAGFEKLLDKLRATAPSLGEVKIGIETPHHLLVDFLIDQDYQVFYLFPGAMKSFRKRYRTSGARDDQFDSFVLADVLRTDRKPWRKIDFGSEQVREIRLITKDYHFMVACHTALSNSLRSTLKAYYPEYIGFFKDVACQTSLAFLLAHPDYTKASKLSRDELGAFFEAQHFRNSKTVNRIYDLLHKKHIMVPKSIVNIKKLKATACAKSLQTMAAEIALYKSRIQKMVEQHPDGQLFLGYPGVSHLSSARLLALFGDNRELYDDVSQLQGLAGTCPVTEKTGNFRTIYYRRGCNKFYRDVLHNIAFSSLTKAKWTMAYYQKHKAMGKGHGHALRCLANLHLKILFAIWKNRTPYDENIYLAQRTRNAIATKNQLILNLA
jgi:transposase